jgi:hypothetical protein
MPDRDHMHGGVGALGVMYRLARPVDSDDHHRLLRPRLPRGFLLALHRVELEGALRGVPGNDLVRDRDPGCRG